MNFPQNQEIWRAVNCFLNYEISSHGRVRNAITGKILKPGLTRGYLHIGLMKDKKRHNIYIHRMVADAFIENKDHENKKCVDHIDNNKLNNYYLNLRWASNRENSGNVNISIKNTSGYKGVSFYNKLNKWQCKVANQHVGYFKTKEEAARAYNTKALELFGEFAKMNVIEK